MTETPSRSEPPGLYVHVPYCRSRCRYCGFYSRAAAPAAGWVDALLCEARLSAPRFEGCAPFDSLYVGGGTPSSLAPRSLAALLRGLRSALSIEGSAEVTVELNPDDVDGPLLGMLADLGVSRISLGVQSFDDRALRWLGRRHDASGAHRALEAVRAAGFAGVGIDLMFGWPGQRVRDWLRELAVALAYAPSHLSCYELTLEPQTPLRRAVEARGEDVGADPARRRALYLAGANRLRGLGWDHYEVSNYARTPRHRSRHNAKYWRHVSYLGLGPSAHSLHARRRWWNLRDLDGYLAAARGGAMPPRGGERLDDEAWRLEAVMLGMRTAEGVSCATLQEVPGVQRALQALVREGLVVVRDEQIRPSLMGFLVADSLPLRFAL